MKIRTRLLLSLLPALIAGIILFAIMAKIQTSEADLILTHRIDRAILGAALLVMIALAFLYFFAGTISAHVQKLNNSALTIAAGKYGESIQIQGPRELQELANTLNTMSQCLLENINRLKENSLIRERSAGEAECARLLQHLMLQKNVDECPFESIAVKAISFSSASPRGLFVDFPPSSRPNIIKVHLAEANEDGFDGIYELLTQHKLTKELTQDQLPFPSLRLRLDRENSTIAARCVGCVAPYLWSLSAGELFELKDQLPVNAGDFVFLMNQGFVSFFKNPARISDLLSRVLKHFASDNLETIAAMLHKELTFAIKRKDLTEDLHLLCIQILSNSQ
jgi:HAMP domain-containing protein